MRPDLGGRPPERAAVVVSTMGSRVRTAVATAQPARPRIRRGLPSGELEGNPDRHGAPADHRPRGGTGSPSGWWVSAAHRCATVRRMVRIVPEIAPGEPTAAVAPPAG